MGKNETVIVESDYKVSSVNHETDITKQQGSLAGDVTNKNKKDHITEEGFVLLDKDSSEIDKETDEKGEEMSPKTEAKTVEDNENKEQITKQYLREMDIIKETELSSMENKNSIIEERETMGGLAIQKPQVCNENLSEFTVVEEFIQSEEIALIGDRKPSLKEVKEVKIQQIPEISVTSEDDVATNEYERPHVNESNEPQERHEKSANEEPDVIHESMAENLSKLCGSNDTETTYLRKLDEGRNELKETKDISTSIQEHVRDVTIVQKYPAEIDDIIFTEQTVHEKEA